MAEATIILGNKNYSSWSLRGWLMINQTGIDFHEIVIPLDEGDYKEAILAHSPAGRVPILKHGGLTIWESLAIGEYLAETFPDAGLWPADTGARARARMVANEMHAGFTALRTHMPMDLRNTWPDKGDGPGVADDVARVLAIWSHCMEAPGAGPFLFGDFCIADAMFAPVVGRFRTYGVEMPAEGRAYADAVWDHPPMRQWLAAAEAEPWVIDNFKI